MNRFMLDVGTCREKNYSGKSS